VAAIGMAAGAGYYWPAVAGAALTVFALWPLRFLVFRAIERFRPVEQRLVVELRHGRSVQELLAQVPEVRQVDVEAERDRRVVTLDFVRPIDQALVLRLSDLDDVVAVRWRR
jgi:uncharacterized membrane protein YhiD involved in acid resistance